MAFLLEEIQVTFFKEKEEYFVSFRFQCCGKKLSKVDSEKGRICFIVALLEKL